MMVRDPTETAAVFRPGGQWCHQRSIFAQFFVYSRREPTRLFVAGVHVSCLQHGSWSSKHKSGSEGRDGSKSVEPRNTMEHLLPDATTIWSEDSTRIASNQSEAWAAKKALSGDNTGGDEDINANNAGSSEGSVKMKQKAKDFGHLGQVDAVVESSQPRRPLDEAHVQVIRGIEVERARRSLGPGPEGVA